MSSVLPSQSSVMATIRQKFPLRSPLPERQNCLWKIETGAVRTLTWLEDGTIVITGLWGPGDILGKALSTVDPYQIECLTTVEAVVLPVASGQTYTELLLSHLQQAEELMLIRSYRRVDTMLIQLLGWLAKRFGRDVKKGNLIDLRLTHQDLADLLGTTRVTVTRMLKQFEEQGLIERLALHRIVLKEYELWHYEI